MAQDHVHASALPQSQYPQGLDVRMTEESLCNMIEMVMDRKDEMQKIIEMQKKVNCVLKLKSMRGL